MCRIWTTALSILLCAGITWATDLEGELNGVLPIDDYTVVGELTIADGGTLTIQPGTLFTFVFDSSFAYSLTVGPNQTLICQGAEEDSIRFNGIRWINMDSTGIDDIIDYCVIEYPWHAGIRCTNESSPTISNTRITDEGNFGSAVGIECLFDSDPNINTCDISGCYGWNEAAIYISNSNPTIAHCTIKDNQGSGIKVAAADPIIRHCLISDNGDIIHYSGGGIHINSASPTISNCIISNNSAQQGGGIYVGWDSSPSFEECTLHGNTAWQGAAIESVSSLNTALVSSIVTEHVGSAVYVQSPNTLDLTYSCFWDNTDGNFSGAGIDPTWGVEDSTNFNGDACDQSFNIFMDPMLVDPANGDFNKLPESPCIDAGDVALPDDPDNSHTDIGAFYNHQDGVYPMLRGELSGVLPAGDYNVIDSLYISGSLTIEPGTNLHFSKEFHWVVESGQTLICQGTETDSIRFLPYYDRGYTQWGSVNLFETGSDELFEYCVFEAAYSQPLQWPDDYMFGGALDIEFSTPTVSHCSFRNCATYFSYASAVMVRGGTPTISHCSFTGNSGTIPIHCMFSGAGAISYCHFEGNTSNAYYLIMISGGELLFSHCTIANNILMSRSGLSTANVLDVYNANATIDHCTLYGNTTSNGEDVHGIQFGSSIQVVVSNTIVSGHETAIIDNDWLEADWTLSNNCFHDNQQNFDLMNMDPALGELSTVNLNGDSCDVFENIYMDPLFNGDWYGDFTLRHDSPCVNAGDPNGPLDPDNTISDIGAFYHHLDPVEVTLIPTGGDLVPMLGGTVEFDVNVVFNLTTAYPGAMFWTKIKLPNQQFYPPILFQIRFTLEPQMNVWGSLTQDIPAFAPPGMYEMWGWVGASPNGGPQFGSMFPFEKEDMPTGSQLTPVTSWASSGSFDIDEATLAGLDIPTDYVLAPAYPNPFNPTTTISVALPEAADLTVTVVNTLGQQVTEISNGRVAAGTHAFTFDASTLASGIYFVHATVPGELNAVQKVVLIK